MAILLVRLLKISLRAQGARVVSRSGTEYHRAGPLDDWAALRWRELEWSGLLKAMFKSLILCLMVREAERLDCAVTNRKGQAAPGQVLRGHAVPCFQW